ncbi:MAG: ribonuclease P protein component [Oscillatoriales cyanobacterium RM1_1_9]|nr:ribonuclease P protein component [Oscillatoriales cyanobacterium SM2_3_0]NJO45724.1 ribonuclease P protein component [Oscillatoriales cyanobacterium RM2_1_1]NJO71943.1 ribonuclease P protein component [Oscillatoriales cyanobacterium RM1_1_9]
MLPRHHRLRRPQDFKSVYARGKRVFGRQLSLTVLSQAQGEPSEPRSQQLPPTRIGISVSQKVSKLAVKRNRIKRQIRAALSQILPNLSPGWDVIIGVKPRLEECNSGEILQELKQLLIKAEVLDGYSRRSYL